jgi:hypothetical protein
MSSLKSQLQRNCIPSLSRICHPATSMDTSLAVFTTHFQHLFPGIKGCVLKIDILIGTEEFCKDCKSLPARVMLFAQLNSNIGMTSLFCIRKQKQIACKQKLIKERDVIPKVPTAAELHSFA